MCVFLDYLLQKDGTTSTISSQEAFGVLSALQMSPVAKSPSSHSLTSHSSMPVLTSSVPGSSVVIKLIVNNLTVILDFAAVFSYYSSVL